MSDKNQAVYASAGIVHYYAQLSQLQPAESSILDQLKDSLPAMKMLDIGIGGGRTVNHFWPLVGDYTGIDSSPAMVAACRQRFAGSSRPMTLAVMDARDMRQFDDSSFDFILFSFNGIDYVSHGDRLCILQEIHRVGKAGGYLLFSSHNLQRMARDFDYRQHLSCNPLRTYENLAMWGLTRVFNRSISLGDIQAAGHLVLKDESHNFRLQTYYIRPEAQVQQLAFGFHSVDVYPWQQSTKMTVPADAAVRQDAWLYYFCVINDRPKMPHKPGP